MARPMRIEYEGAVYHVTSRGNERKAVFRNDKDRKTFLDVLKKVNTRYNIICHSYCLMKNHYHLLLETPSGNLSKGMRQLNGVYTQAFNRRHRRVGHIFQGRYKAILIQKESHLLEVCRYVVLNPVRAMIIKKPEEWKWSSYTAVAGINKPHECLTTDWILGQFGKKKREAEKRYREFVKAGIGGKNIWQDVRGQSLLGKEEFVESLIGYVNGYEGIKEIPKNQRYGISRPGLRDLIKDEVLQNKIEIQNNVKDAVEKHGYSQKEVADHIGIHYSTVSRMINARNKT